MTKSTFRTSSSPRLGTNKKTKHPKTAYRNDSKRPAQDQPAGLTVNDLAPVLFPRLTPVIVFVVTLAIRVLYVINPSNWWMVHPDEVYQATEVAHIEAYGYGFRTYDFTAPDSPSGDTTRYRQMEIRAGMAALRSPIFPSYYILVSKFLSAVDIEVNPYVLWRVAHVCVTSLLPLAVHRYVIKLYKDPDRACASSLLVAASTHLNVLGTHCLLHSFLAPFTVLAVSMLSALSGDGSVLLVAVDDSDSGGGQIPSARKLSNHEMLLGDRQIDSHSSRSNSNSSSSNGSSKNNKTSSNIGITNTPRNKLKTELKKTKLESDVHSANSYNENNNNKSINTPRLNMKNNCARVNCVHQHYVQAILVAFIATLTIYIRCDIFLVYFIHFVLFPEFRQFQDPLRTMCIILGASGGLVIGIGSDFCFYGWGVFSTLNWLNFNIVSGFSHRIFGEMNWMFYVEKLLLQNYGITTMLSFAMCVLFIHILKAQKKEQLTQDISKTKLTDVTNIGNYRTEFNSFLVWFMLFVIYSINKHKETRFIHDVIIFMLIFIADIIGYIKLYFRSQICNNVIILIFAGFTVTQYLLFPSNSENLDWTYQRTTGVNDVNQCIKYISEQTDVTGVFYDSNIYMTGGMSLLHHNVPVFSLVENGFYEFAPKSRGDKLHESNTSNEEANKENDTDEFEASIREFTKAQNYIAVSNAPAAFRLIIQKECYNYLVLRKDRKMVDFGFHEVFAVGSRRVLKRLLDRESEEKLQQFLDRMSLDNNVTVLLHEGDVLFNMNQYREAAERFYQALTLDDKLVEAYLPLEMSYRSLGNDKAAAAVYGKCVSMFDPASCTTPRKITRI